MKHNTFRKPLTSLILLASVSPLTLPAIERNSPANQPRENRASLTVNNDGAEAEQRAYLGVVGQEASKAIRKQLNLDPDSGVTLLFVEKGSPADNAGLKKHDIITSINGENIGSQQELKEALSSCEPNEAVQIETVTNGQKEIKITQLGSKKAPNRRAAKNQPRRKNKAEIHGNRNGVRGKASIIPEEMLNNLPPQHREMIEKLNMLPSVDLGIDLNIDDIIKNGGISSSISSSSSSNVQIVDSEGSVRIRTRNGVKDIEIKGPDGEVLYEGAFNNDEDRNNIPEDLRDRVDKINTGGCAGGKKRGGTTHEETIIDEECESSSESGHKSESTGDCETAHETESSSKTDCDFGNDPGDHFDKETL